jgi:hypothetical protein
MGIDGWNSPRDQTPMLAQFECTASRSTCKLLLTPLHTFATLDDDLYGTKAADNHVKLLSSRKADKEGHCSDSLADAMFRVTFMVRFRRRGESQSKNVMQLMESVLQNHGEQSLHGFVITADRGFVPYLRCSVIPICRQTRR